MATAVSVTATNNAEIDGLLAGVKWSGAISYSFPDASSDYAVGYGSGEPTATGFSQAPGQMQAAINYAVSLILGYTNATIQYAGTNGADLMIAQSSAANPTSYAYYPGNYVEGGDVWFGTAYNYSLAALGNYYFTTALHELGHALGLKHSQETGGVANVAVPTAHDDLEYTLMSYRSYVGGPLTGYTNEAYGYPQTYMANDILALQTMYGANYTTHSENTVYTWNPTTGQESINGVAQLAPGGGAGGSANRVFETIWDGGGVDTYDLSNYTTNLTLNLNPGAASLLSSAQLAYLGNGNYASGNVYNAYLYNGDARSYIDNAYGGTGNDTMIGNAVANVLRGGGGNDTITGGGGNDTIDGGPGTDTAVYSGNRANYLVSYNATAQTFTIADQRAGSPDGTDTVTSVEYFQFADGTVASSGFIAPVVIESLGTTELVQVGGSYYFNPVAGGTGPVLKSGGVAVIAGQSGGWSPIGAEQTASGYEVAWKLAGSDEYSVWSTDSNGNYVSNIIGVAPGADGGLQSLETSFHQDLNGDGTIGPVAAVGTVIEALGSTSLVQVGGNYLFNPVAGGSGPSLKSGGVAVIAGQSGGWSPIGAEQTASGYEVAWKLAGSDEYSVWSTDSNGNYVSNIIGVAPGADGGLQSLETSFHQDLNGDGTIGPVAAVGTVIEALGSTSLVQVGGNYLFNPVAGGSGPSLKSGGVAVIAGQSGGWSPIGAEQTASGYEVAWKLAGSDEYSVWSTDSNGNYVSNIIGVAPGADGGLQSLETSFHQDLNGDGTIGPVAAVGTVIEALGSTSLVQVGGNYLFNPVAGGSGPSLKSGGVAVIAGQSGGWSPIGAEQTASGYEVAWKLAGSDEYSVWSTDSNGNYVSNIIGVAPGADGGLQSLETSFHQDLNGDGTIGPPPSTVTAGTPSADAPSGSNMFSGSTLTLHAPSTFTGQIVGFSCDGTLAGSDMIDLLGLDFQSLHSRFDSSSGVLSMSDGSATATLQFVGQYAQDSFHFADDSHGGTSLVAATQPGQPTSPIFNPTAHDTFVFAPSFGHVTLASFAPATDTIQFSKSLFTDVAALLAATHDDASGNAAIVDSAGDVITLQHVTRAQLVTFQSDFHFV